MGRDLHFLSGIRNQVSDRCRMCRYKRYSILRCFTIIKRPDNESLVCWRPKWHREIIIFMIFLTGGETWQAACTDNKSRILLLPTTTWPFWVQKIFSMNEQGDELREIRFRDLHWNSNFGERLVKILIHIGSFSDKLSSLWL